MKFSPLIDELIDSLRCLPGVGARSAQRMAFQLLERDRQGGRRLASSLEQAMVKVTRCQDCQNFTEDTLCRFCSDQRRDDQIICVVEAPSDLMAVEQSGSYQGRYFVLMGHLSPLDGLGPEEIGLHKLFKLIEEKPVKELILATNPTVEGEATAHYIAQHLEGKHIYITRIAQGIPVGGELGFTDGGTLLHAFSGRKPLVED
jgi:recombination protein RecR